MTDTLRIWNAVSKTDPANTKKVNQRGGFTSICAQSQIMEATRQFGPIGEGWGYVANEPMFHENLVFVRVTLWHGDRGNSFGPVTGGAEWKSDKGRVDSDAPKKATTDALTKLLSQLGFNADVFLGLYDDNKYIEQVTKEFAEPAKPVKLLISEAQRDELMLLLESTGYPVGEFLTVSKITDLRQLPAAKFGGARDWITQQAQKEAAE